jgi:quinol monooxygenase YgiN
MHYIVRFEPRVDCADRFREELQRVADASRLEPGCLRMEIFETIRPPISFAIHSEWVDEAAFDLHAGLPHTQQFVRAAEELLTEPALGLRMGRVL